MELLIGLESLSTMMVDIDGEWQYCQCANLRDDGWSMSNVAKMMVGDCLGEIREGPSTWA